MNYLPLKEKVAFKKNEFLKLFCRRRGRGHTCETIYKQTDKRTDKQTDARQNKIRITHISIQFGWAKNQKCYKMFCKIN